MLRTSKRQPQGGFSLLEILIALTIAATVCGLAFSIVGQSSRTATVNRHYQTALLLAESKMAELSANPQRWLGEHQDDYNDTYFWQAQVQRYQDDTTAGIKHPFALYQIDLQVGWQPDQASPISLSTLRLGRQR